MKTCIKKQILIFIFFSLSMHISAKIKTSYIGTLIIFKKGYIKSPYSEIAGIRALFKKTEKSDWYGYGIQMNNNVSESEKAKVFSKINGKLDWYIYSGNKNIGKISTIWNKPSSVKEYGVMKSLSEFNKLEKIKKTYSKGNTPNPFIISTANKINIPEGWIEEKDIDRNISKKTRKIIIQNVSRYQCNPTIDDELVDISPNHKEIIIKNIFKTKDKLQYLISLDIHKKYAKRLGCDPLDRGNDFLLNHWIYISKQKVGKYLRNNISLLHKGDYDNDGKTEWLFRDNSLGTGFVLISDNFLKTTQYGYDFH